MKNFKDFQTDVKVYYDITTNAQIRKYRAFMDYMSKIISTIFKNNEQEIISWLNAIDNNDSSIILQYNGGSHYIQIGIGLSNDKSHIEIIWFGASGDDCNPKIDFNSTDVSIIEFFIYAYNDFLKLCTPCCYDYDADNIVTEFVDRFNTAFWKTFKSIFKPIGLNDTDDFGKSKYVLTVSDEKLSEISKQILTYYDAFSKIAQESNCVIASADKMWYTD